MTFIKWTDSLSVGVAEIDEQHKNLINLINSLHDAMLKRQGKEVLADILDKLAAYTVYHFSTEEKFMEQCNYQGLYYHKKEHEKFVDKIDSFIRDYQADKLGLTIELMAFLKDWISNHILVTDKKYAALFNEKGIV
ncbi:MAG: hemerythrin family protein [Methanomicrobiales archaeon]|jgi:hemerythrin|nr:bacteriohemerythrin [Methanospirillum sp.]NLV26079.1 hemerythrin family protein [Methanomicrobiales archaeon]OQB56731.1 MAG: Bacteriohemerythrin [Bacteroidetes bacterium ADurb.Bin145]HPY60642.1 bacteriohemerythrin [Methanospirillum sp.]HQB98927.1 bacteriohemerythrin [Methanospirillum sp.]